MASSRGRAFLFVCLGLASACGLAPEDTGEQQASAAAGEARDDVKAAAVLTKQTRLAPAGGLETSRLRAVAASTFQKYHPTSVVWGEDDAKLLLALVLKGMCSALAGCEPWLRDALELGPQGSVMLSEAGSARLAAQAAALRSAGQDQRALQIEEWEANAASDLESVSSIGISAAAVQHVLAGLLGPAPLVTPHLQLGDFLTFRASALGPVSALALEVPARAFVGVLPASKLTANVAIPFDRAIARDVSIASGLSGDADAYILELYAQVRRTSATALAPACPVPQSDLAGLAAHDKALPLGSVECASASNQLDSALDTSCENLGPGKVYCMSEDPQHEWATGRSPHAMNVPFAASARRCEPCRDGYGAGTLRIIRNAANVPMTMCDTWTPECDPTVHPEVSSCSCMR